MSHQVQQPYGHYVGGEWTGGAGEETFESVDPATGATIGEFHRGTAADVERAVGAAESAFEEWRAMSYVDRAEVLWEVYHELRERTDELGAVVTRECGKEISEGRADVVEAAHMVEWAAGNARHPHGDVVPSEIAEKDAYMRRRPRGVVGCITPWNFPVAIPFWHMAVTLVEGNTVVWKPAEQTPLCGRIVAEMMDDAGVPPGVFNMVQGFGDAGNAVVEDERVSTVLFTGSAEVGHMIADELGGAPGREVSIEMGGKNAVVVTEHADLDLAVHAAVMSSFKTTGQRCVSSERLIVHGDVYDEFRSRFVDVAESVAVGDPLDEDTFMGPVVDADQVEKFHRYNELARQEGATVLVDRAELDPGEIPDGPGGGGEHAQAGTEGERTGDSVAGERGGDIAAGKRGGDIAAGERGGDIAAGERGGDIAAGERGGDFADGFWVGPFVYEIEYDPDLRCIHEEVFGPHVALIEYSGDIEDAMEIHNDVPYGLTGAIVSEDYRQINHFRDNAEVGLAYGNLPCIGAEVQLPFGGVKKSGKGSPSAREVIEAVTERTAWTLNNSTDVEMAQGLSAEIRTTDE